MQASNPEGSPLRGARNDGGEIAASINGIL